MKKIILLFILISSFSFAQMSKVDSIFNKYKSHLDIYGIYDSTIFDLEIKRNDFNEVMGQIILETDQSARKNLIIKNIPKEKHTRLLKMNDSELEVFRKDYDEAFKAKIASKCITADIEQGESQLDYMEKNKAKFLIDQGYNLADFNKLSIEKKSEILKNWKF